jgi:hypothetical protein
MWNFQKGKGWHVDSLYLSEQRKGRSILAVAGKRIFGNSLLAVEERGYIVSFFNLII